MFYNFMLDGKPGKEKGEFEGWQPFAGKVASSARVTQMRRGRRGRDL